MTLNGFMHCGSLIVILSLIYIQNFSTSVVSGANILSQAELVINETDFDGAGRMVSGFGQFIDRILGPNSDFGNETILDPKKVRKGLESIGGRFVDAGKALLDKIVKPAKETINSITRGNFTLPQDNIIMNTLLSGTTTNGTHNSNRDTEGGLMNGLFDVIGKLFGSIASVFKRN